MGNFFEQHSDKGINQTIIFLISDNPYLIRVITVQTKPRTTISLFYPFTIPMKISALFIFTITACLFANQARAQQKRSFGGLAVSAGMFTHLETRIGYARTIAFSQDRIDTTGGHLRIYRKVTGLMRQLINLETAFTADDIFIGPGLATQIYFGSFCYEVSFGYLAGTRSTNFRSGFKLGWGIKQYTFFAGYNFPVQGDNFNKPNGLLFTAQMMIR